MLKEVDLELDHAKIIDRMIEEAGVDNARRMCEAMDTGVSYAYQLKKRGLTGGFIEKYITTYPKADLNYIFTGDRSRPGQDPADAVRTLINYLLDDDEVLKEVTRKYGDAIENLSRSLSQEDYREEILRSFLLFLQVALENRK